jgi:hypothetical protein
LCFQVSEAAFYSNPNKSDIAIECKKPGREEKGVLVSKIVPFAL